MSTVFRYGEELYEADTCEPLRMAVEKGELELTALARGDYPGTTMPNSWLPGVRTIGYWDAPRQQSWGLDWHRNEGIEFTYLAGGSTPFSADGIEYDLGKNHLTITRPWQSHRVGDPNVAASRLHWLILDVGVRRPNQVWRWPDWLVLSSEDVRRLTQLLQLNEHPVWFANDSVGATFEAIAEVVSNPTASTRQSRLQLLVNNLLVDILELLETQWVPLDIEPDVNKAKRAAVSQRLAR
ncbi:hypothetical protein PSQ19_15035 [Devosia algicola]|uniref:AraC family transcriptional regulator n=1 Tax=Devosia algicola TaxID=3026418 RepID=A0ABY7YL85_9HYPH|nr:hypothetical protein [Devosia algicola]WDR01987.1 hypothetical protein PSQ19_15035 [Devosia algicola]